MNILKDRAIWIAIVIIFMSASAYMILIDPDRVDKMDNIEQRDDTRIKDVNEVKELFDRLDKKLIGTKKHLSELRKETELHIKAYSNKVDSIDNKFQRVDLDIKKVKQDLTKGLQNLGDDIEDLDDDLSSLKTKTNQKLRKIDNTLGELKSYIEKLDERLW